MEPVKDEVGVDTQRNIFARHPKKTLIFILLIILILFTYLAEKLVAYKIKPQVHQATVPREIRLREYAPLHSGFLHNHRHRIDENGFIMPSKVHDQADVTLVFLGGSTTECFDVDETVRFPYLTGRLLEKKSGLRVNAYNAAMAGNNSLHSINILLNKVIPLQPNVVFMMHNINDLAILLHEDSYWNKNKYKSPIIDQKATYKTFFNNFGANLKLLRDLMIPNLYAEFKVAKRKFGSLVYGPRQVDAPKEDEFQATRRKKITINKDYLLKTFKANLQLFIDICKAKSIMPVLLTQMNRLKDQPDADIKGPIEIAFQKGHGITYEQFKDLYDSFNQAIRMVGRQNDVLVIDLAAEVPQEKDYMLDIVHLTEKGNRLIARLISEILKDDIFMKSLNFSVVPHNPALLDDKAVLKE